MSSATIPAVSTPRPHPATTTRREGYLFSPIIDFALLGGGSIAPLLAMMLLPSSARNVVALVFLILANVVNHPHFAHSYQIFYRDYRKKITPAGPDADPSSVYSDDLRRRYVFAGIVVPLLIVGFYASTMAAGSPRTLGYGVNVMGFLVGWHYVKQGYGMLMVDSTLKRRFLDDRTKRVLVINAYVNWLSIYAVLNNRVDSGEYFGVPISTIAVPQPLTLALIAGSVVTTLGAAVLLAQRVRTGKAIALNGLVSYAVSIYLWRLLAFDPIATLAVPLFHSLQYLTVVWRYQLNASDELAQTRGGSAKKMFRKWVLGGTVMGALGFWLIPIAMTAVVPYDTELFGGAVFVFMAWIAINVHHYCIDNVIWRRANPTTSRYLFK